MNVADIHRGLWVRVTNLVVKTSLVASPSLLMNRREGGVGQVLKPMTNFQNAWWVQHDHGSAPYRYHEIEALDPQPPVMDDWRGDPIF